MNLKRYTFSDSVTFFLGQTVKFANGHEASISSIYRCKHDGVSITLSSGDTMNPQSLNRQIEG